MKISKILAAALFVLSLSGVAHATYTAPGTVIHITGSTAFRKATIIAIENLFLNGPAGGSYTDGTAITTHKFRAAYNGTAGAGNEQGATYVVFEGNITGCTNPVLIKTAWAGSTGGLITTANHINVNWTATSGFLSSNNLNSLTEAAAVGSASIAGGVSDFTTTAEGDGAGTTEITMADSHQESVGISGLVPATTGGSVPGQVAIVTFEFVANNGVTAPVKFTGCTSAAGSTTMTYLNAYNTSVASGTSGYTATSGQVAAVNILGGGSIARNVAVTVTGNGTTGGTITLGSANTSASAINNATYVGAVNGSNPITNTNALLEQALLKGGGAYLSQFTGNSADANVAVYAAGRNFDSGTRLSELAETGVGVFGTVNAQLQPSFIGGVSYASQTFSNGGKGGGADQYLATLDVWKGETIFPAPYTKTFANGESGYNGGGDLAALLATPGSVGTTDSNTGGINATAPLFNGGTFAQDGGWLVGYLGRSDANAACKATVGANTAHRLTWNGVADWTGTANADGTVTVNDAVVQEGLYPLWEFEYLYSYSGATTAQKAVANALAARLYSTDAINGGPLVSSMNVTKTSEGQVITHN